MSCRSSVTVEPPSTAGQHRLIAHRSSLRGAAMTTTDITDLTLAGAADAIRAGDLSPVELTDALLDRIERLEPRLNAFITVTAESARAEARAAQDGAGPDGPLRGAPIALKDLFDTAGVRTTGGTKVHKDRVPERDATVVARLRAAGAVF